MTPSVTFHAHAKINWCLELLRKREDGYHEILTVTHTVSLYDELRVRLGAPAEGEPRLRVTGEWPAPEDESNLCRRAAEAFWQAFGPPQEVGLELHKRIPPGAGLGGGSSDGVATLVALQRLTGLGSPAQLAPLAARLGSDTSLFLSGGAALCSGRGEIVQPLRCPARYDLVIAKPEGEVATREAYGMIGPEDLSDGAATWELAARLWEGAAPGSLRGMLRNAFRRKMEAAHPRIGELVARLLRGGALDAQMTGSGSAVFGLMPDAASAAALAGGLAAEGTWAVAVRTVDCGHRSTEVCLDA
jgi:4-diphosphocytidyl-2-C-methyl-D-erythritol kinase